MVATLVNSLSAYAFDDARRLNALLYSAIGESLGYSWPAATVHYDLPSDIRDGSVYLRKSYRLSSQPHYGMEVSASYALRYFPQNYLKARNVLLGVAELDQAPTQLSVLDLGAGPGTMALSLIDALAFRSAEREFSVTFVDRSPAMASLAGHTLVCHASSDSVTPHSGQAVRVHQAIDGNFCLPDTVRRLAGDCPYDFVAFGNCLRETFGSSAPPSIWAAQAASIVLTYAALLGDGGYLLVMEPALLRLVDGMSELRDILLSRAGLREVVWSSNERLSEEQCHATPSICLEILGPDIAHAWENGTPSTFLLLRKDPMD